MPLIPQSSWPGWVQTAWSGAWPVASATQRETFATNSRAFFPLLGMCVKREKDAMQYCPWLDWRCCCYCACCMLAHQTMLHFNLHVLKQTRPGLAYVSINLLLQGYYDGIYNLTLQDKKRPPFLSWLNTRKPERDTNDRQMRLSAFWQYENSKLGYHFITCRVSSGCTCLCFEFNTFNHFVCYLICFKYLKKKTSLFCRVCGWDSGKSKKQSGRPSTPCCFLQNSSSHSLSWLKLVLVLCHAQGWGKRAQMKNHPCSKTIFFKNLFVLLSIHKKGDTGMKRHILSTY